MITLQRVQTISSPTTSKGLRALRPGMFVQSLTVVISIKKLKSASEQPPKLVAFVITRREFILFNGLCGSSSNSPYG